MGPCSALDLGSQAEAMAQHFLAACGFHLLAHRYRKRSGEVDLVVRQGPLVVFVEVKARRSVRFGVPEASVTAQKCRRLRQVAREFLQERCLAGTTEYRFDVIAVDFAGEGQGCCLRHFAGAF